MSVACAIGHIVDTTLGVLQLQGFESGQPSVETIKHSFRVLFLRPICFERSLYGWIVC
jgi:hypothetical protein